MPQLRCWCTITFDLNAKADQWMAARVLELYHDDLRVRLRSTLHKEVYTFRKRLRTAVRPPTSSSPHDCSPRWNRWNVEAIRVRFTTLVDQALLERGEFAAADVERLNDAARRLVLAEYPSARLAGNAA